MKTALMIPTLNAGSLWTRVLSALGSQTVQPDRKIVIDSSSVDGTAGLAKEHGFEVIGIPSGTFNHGLTRQLGADACSDSEGLIYMTQDAVLSDPRSLERLLSGLDCPKAGAAYGRQLPREGAVPLEAFARHYNYPAKSEFKTFADIPRFGIRTAFCSNSFAVWRKTALDQIGGFPKTDFGEDMLAAARLLQNRWAVVYCAEAAVIHSHSMSVREEFLRSQMIGRMHRQNPWLEEQFGRTADAGKKYLTRQIGFLAKKAPKNIPLSLLAAGAKFSGFTFGKMGKMG